MSALSSQGQLPIIDSTLPPMPRRQSCDRCHEQKVRCVTNAYDPSTPGLGTIREETQASRGRSVVASIPCVRCSKAGAVCIFSPQLRSGRPRVHRHPVRKRARRSSKCSSSPTQSQSLSPRPFTFSFSAPNTTAELESQSHTPTTPLLLSTTILPSFERSYSNQGGTDYSSPTTPLSNFGLPINQDGISLRHNHFQAMPHSVESSSAEFMSQFSDKVLSATSTATSTATSNVVWMYSDSSEEHLEEVTQINLRIHRAGRILCSLTRTLLATSSPAINEIFDAACSLIGFMDRYATQQMISPSTPDGYQISPGVTGGSAPIKSATETSICLTALASHQLLLGVLEDLCTSFLSVIDRGRSARSPNTPSTSSHSQMLAMANLISHLLEQLDRALRSLTIQHATPESSEGLTVAAAAVASTHDSEFDHALGFGHPPEASLPCRTSGYVGQDHEKRAPPLHQSGVLSMILAQVEQRQVRTRKQLVMLKGLLGQDGV
ncbi:hypothetical protein QBC40DRAFT_286078 [Triangularia verruculosa]|uniref:Zn(2)-C6 fungal-type domain-containing protein n=1 Tax=Triangularia verruculosa TaxID=2587418 RepID=A0AAN7AQ95_9PEZI|nr:hypothetical protein QBC40DRAFT_286078 [Triangularia verruculosa]